MPKISVDAPYLSWRKGRPRWQPGPGLRRRRFTGRDLKYPQGHDRAGEWMGFEDAAAECRRIMQEEVEGGQKGIPPARSDRTVSALLDDFCKSKTFDRLAKDTQDFYRTRSDCFRFKPRSKAEIKAARDHKKRTGEELPRKTELFGQVPVTEIGKPEVKAFFEYLVEVRGLHVAKAAVMTLSAAWTWGSTSTVWRLKGENPCHRLNLPAPEARIRIGTEEEIRAIVAAADEAGHYGVGDAIYTALFSGQRPGDVQSLSDFAGDNRGLVERARDGEPIRFRQSKTGARVAIFAAPQLVARLAEAEKRRRALPVVPDAVIVDYATGRAYNAHTFRHHLDEARAKAAETVPGAATLRFQDLRDTAVTWLARSGATIPEIASITGHSLRSIYNILKHYLDLDETLAKSAIGKLVAWMEEQEIAL